MRDDLAVKEAAIKTGGERLQIAYVRLSQAALWDRNPKRHDLRQIAQSIARYGFKDPPKYEPALNNGAGGVVEGNGRLSALRLMKDTGLEMDVLLEQGRVVPPGILEMTDGEWAIPLLFGVDAQSQASAEAYGVDHNNLTLAGGDFTTEDMRRLWDSDVLISILQDQNAETLPVTADGFDALGLLALVNQDDDGEKQPSRREKSPPDLTRAAELEREWNVRVGDLWAIPSRSHPELEHRLMCGDSTDAATVAALLARKQAVMLFADPPYGMGKQKDGIANDNLYAAKLDRFQMTWWRAWRQGLVDNGSAYIWGNALDLWRLWYGYLLADDGGGLADSERLTFRNEIVWGKLTHSGEDFDAIGIRSDEMRMFPPCSERCHFFMLGEQGFNANMDNYWEGWEPVRKYLAAEVERLGWGPKEVREITNTHMFGHWFTRSQWVFIGRRHYMALREASGGEAFLRPYDSADLRGDGAGVALERERVKLAEAHQALRAEFCRTRAWFDNTHDRLVDVWSYPRVLLDARYEHPSPKPLDLVKRAIKSSAPVGGRVLSPFAGSGTDLAAAEETGRECYAMEISPKWTAVSLQRLVDLGLEPYQVGV